MKRIYFFHLFLIILNLLSVAIISLLGLKIKDKLNGRVKGVQYATVIKKENLIFEPENKELKYFYEPKANNIETAKADWLGYEAKYTINADTLNERYDYSVEKKKKTFRIITIGDSFTFGQFVNTSDNYPERLEDLLNNQLKCKDVSQFEVINLGVMGYDTEYTVERFLKRGIKYQPDLVLWLINPHNLEEIMEIVRPIVDESELAKGVSGFDLKNGWAKYDLVVAKAKEFYKDGYLEKHKKETFLRFSKFYSGNLLVLTLWPFNQYRSLITNFISLNQNYKYFDKLLEDYWGSDSYMLADGHPTRQGHKRIAENLFEYLSKEHLISCD